VLQGRDWEEACFVLTFRLGHIQESCEPFSNVCADQKQTNFDDGRAGLSNLEAAKGVHMKLKNEFWKGQCRSFDSLLILAITCAAGDGAFPRRFHGPRGR